MKIIVLLIGIVFLIGCSKNDEKSNSIILLKVDYTTHVFEGAHEQFLSGNITESDTIPIKIDYQAPGDFGNISLYYEPTNELLFDGSIVWNGTGGIKYPASFQDPSAFLKLNDSLDLPDSSKIENYDKWVQLKFFDFSKIWYSINDLTIVAEYLKSHKKIYIFLYQPSVGFGDPNTWDWFVIMNKK